MICRVVRGKGLNVRVGERDRWKERGSEKVYVGMEQWEKRK